MYHQTLTGPSNGYDGVVDGGASFGTLLFAICHVLASASAGSLNEQLSDLTAFRPIGVRFRAEPSAFNPSHFSTSPLDSLIDLGSALRPEQQHVFRPYDFTMHPPRSDHGLFEDASINVTPVQPLQQQRSYQGDQ